MIKPRTSHEIRDERTVERPVFPAARNEAMTAVFSDWPDQDRADLTRLLTKLVDSLESATSAALGKGTGR